MAGGVEESPLVGTGVGCLRRRLAAPRLKEWQIVCRAEQVEEEPHVRSAAEPASRSTYCSVPPLPRRACTTRSPERFEVNESGRSTCTWTAPGRFRPDPDRSRDADTAAGAATFTALRGEPGSGYASWFRPGPRRRRSGPGRRIVVEPAPEPDPVLTDLFEQIPAGTPVASRSARHSCRPVTRWPCSGPHWWSRPPHLTWLPEPEVREVLDLLINTTCGDGTGTGGPSERTRSAVCARTTAYPARSSDLDRPVYRHRSATSAPGRPIAPGPVPSSRPNRRWPSCRRRPTLRRTSWSPVWRSSGCCSRRPGPASRARSSTSRWSSPICGASSNARPGPPAMPTW